MICNVQISLYTGSLETDRRSFFCSGGFGCTCCNGCPSAGLGWGLNIPTRLPHWGLGDIFCHKLENEQNSVCG